MALDFKSDETDHLARHLAEFTGESLTAVTIPVRTSRTLPLKVVLPSLT